MAFVTGPCTVGSCKKTTSEFFEARSLGHSIVDAEARVRDSVFDQRRLDDLGGRVFVGFEQQLYAVRKGRQDDGEPRVVTEGECRSSSRNRAHG